MTLGAVLAVLAIRLGREIRGPKNVVDLEKASEEGAYASAEEFTYTRTEGDRVVWELKARSGEYRQTGELVTVHDVEAVFHTGKDGNVRVTGPAAVMHTDTQNVEINGGVRAVSTLGYTLRTDRVTYGHADDEIRAPERVFVKGPGLSAGGGSLTMHLGDEIVEVEGGVTAVIWDMEKLKAASGAAEKDAAS